MRVMPKSGTSGTLFDDPATLEAFRRGLETKPDAVVCTHVSNVFGYILPIGQIAALCREADVPLVIDASQSAGTLPLSLRETGAAFVACPGHEGGCRRGRESCYVRTQRVRSCSAGRAACPNRRRCRPFCPTGSRPGRTTSAVLRDCSRACAWACAGAARSVFWRMSRRLRAAGRDRGAGASRACSGALRRAAFCRSPKTVDCEEAAQRLADAGIAVRAGCTVLRRHTARPEHCKPGRCG